MSSWGNLDNVTAAGTVYVATANANAVLGVSTYFTVNVKAGDYLTIAANKYQVEQVVSNTVIYLTASAATNSAGVKAYIQQGPKYIANVSTTENVYTIQRVIGADSVEVLLANNKSFGNVNHTGWNHVMTYTDAYGARRIKSEVLVAMSKNFNVNGSGTLQDDYLPDNTLAANV